MLQLDELEVSDYADEPLLLLGFLDLGSLFNAKINDHEKGCKARNICCKWYIVKRKTLYA